MNINEEQAKLIFEAIEQFKVLYTMDTKEAYLLIRKLIEQYTHFPEYTKHLSCGSIKNCSMCCHDTILMGEVEAEFIKSYIKDNNIAFSKERVELQNSNVTLKWEDKACPMLKDLEDGNRLCSIYENRPLICRTHNSVSDPILCFRENGQNTKEASIIEMMALSFLAIDLKSKNIKNVMPKLISMNSILNEL